MVNRLRVVGLALVSTLAGAALTGCGSGQSSPSWTPVGPGSSSPSAMASCSGSASASGTPSPGATSAEWKTFTDPGKTVSFELPAQWLVQAGPAAAGSSQGALHFDVKK